MDSDTLSNHMEKQASNGDEMVLIVSPEFASFSLGFAIDAGGSATKILYRSKEDYVNGIPTDVNCPHGKLRLRFMKNDDEDNLIAFLKDRCDVIPTLGTNASVKDAPTWYQIGVGVQHYIEKLDGSFHIRTKLNSEMDAIRTCLKEIYLGKKNIPDVNESPLMPPSKRIFDKALRSTQQFMKGVESLQGALGHDPVEERTYTQKLLTWSSAELLNDLSISKLEYPCLAVMIGSTTHFILLEENGRVTFLDFGTVAGKTLFGLGMELTGAKDFSELMKIVESGDTRKVNTYIGDTQRKGRTVDDFYNNMVPDILVFALGKLSDPRFQGSYGKEDVVLGIFRSYCQLLVKSILMSAFLYKVKAVTFFGSFFSSNLLRELMEELFFEETLRQPFFGRKGIPMGVFRNPGHFCALGTWCKNLLTELEHKHES